MLDLPITEITFSRNLLSCANIDAKKVLDSLEENDCRKRRRLDDFTPQEKLIRRKLKNRVAAQSARDRKKERMTELEEIVGRLEVQNNQLKSSNEELQANMKFLLDQNKELRTKLGMDDSHSPEMKGDHTYTLKRKLDDTSMDQENGLDSKHIMVKEEEGFEFEHASLKVSLQKKMQILLVSLIMMWLSNPRLTKFLTSLNKSKQEKVLRIMLQKKLEAKLKEKSNKTSKQIQLLLQMNLTQIFQACLLKKQRSYYPSVKKSQTWWDNQMIL